MSLAKSSQVVADEETPLLHDDDAQRKPTPLPKTQLFLLLLVRLAEPIASHSISPYISEVGPHLLITLCDALAPIFHISSFSLSVSFRSLAATSGKWGITQAC